MATNNIRISIFGAMLAAALFISLPAKAEFSLEHKKGVYDKWHNNGHGNLMQTVHTDYQILYAKPGEKVHLYRPERCTFVGYVRWYCYDTDRAVPSWYSADDSPTGVARSRIESMWQKDTTQGKFCVRNEYGWFAYNYAQDRVTTGDVSYIELRYFMHKGDSVYRIACDEGIWIDSIGNWSGRMTEPTLSKRIIYEIRPAKWMADSLEKHFKVEPEKPNDNYLEEHEIIAPTGRQLYIGPDMMCIGSVDGTLIKLPQYRYYALTNYYYYNSQKTVTAAGQKNKWKWYKKVGNGAEEEDPSIVFKDSTAQYAAVSSLSKGKVTYMLKYNSATGYYFNVARFTIKYMDVDSVGPSTEVPAPTKNMEKIYEETFNYDRPNTTDYAFWRGHFPADESTYGYYNKNLDETTETSVRKTRKGNITWSEYAVTNRKSVWVPSGTAPQVYQHVDGKGNEKNNAKEGYMLYCDGSQQAGLVFNLKVNADLCPGSTMYFSAWLCDASSEKDLNSTEDAKYRSAPNMDFIVTGIDAEGNEHALTTFTTGEFGFNAVITTSEPMSSTNRMERAKWYQIRFPVTFSSEAKTFHSYRLRIKNKSTSSDGNDFAIDDIRIYVQKPPVIPIQASTSDCVDKAVDSIRAYLRIDYQELDDIDTLYYQWREKGSTSDRIVHNTYFNIDSVENDYKSTTFGRVPVKEDKDITESDTCMDLFSFDKKFRETKVPVYRYIKEEVAPDSSRYMMYIAQPIEVHINREYTGFVALDTAELGKRTGCGTFADMLVAGGTRITLNDEITFGDSVVTVCGHREYTLNIVLTKVIQDETQGTLRVDTSHCRADWLIGDSTYVKEHSEIYKYSFEQIETYLKFYRQNPTHPAAKQMLNFLKQHNLLIMDTAAITMSPGISLSYTAFPLEGTSISGEAVCTTPRFLHIKPAVPASNMMVVGKDSNEYKVLPEVVKERPRIVRISDSQRKEGWFDVPLWLKGTETIDKYIIDTVYLISSTDPACKELGIIADHRPMSDPDTIHFGYNDEATIPIKSLKPGFDYTFHVAFAGENDENRCDRGYTYFTLRVVPDTVTWLGGDWNHDSSWDYAIPMDTTNVILRPDTNYNVSFATDPAESYDFNYTRNKCRNIYIPANTSMKGQEDIEIRGIAYVDIPVPAQKWALTSVPIKGIVSGDLFVKQDESTNPFEVAHIDHSGISETAFDRYTYEVYDSPFDAATNTWLRPDSNLSRPIRPYDAVMVAADCEDPAPATNPVIRLPKPVPENKYPEGHFYRYYDFNTNNWRPEDTTVIAEYRAELGKPAWDGKSPVTLTRAQNNMYMFGNPTFGYIDLTQLMADNPDELTGKYYMPSDDMGTLPGSIALATINPSDDPVLLPPHRGVLLEGNGDANLNITINVADAPETPATPAPIRRMQTSSSFDRGNGMPIGAITIPPIEDLTVTIDEWSMTIYEELYPWFNNDIPTLHMNRELFRDGYYNTICLPFSMTPEEIAASPLTGAQLFTFTSAEKTSDLQLEIEVSSTDHIEAGIPYLIKWDPTDPEIIPTPLVFTDVHIDDIEGQTIGETDEVQFVGSVPRKLMVFEDKNNLFVGANDILYWPNTHRPLRGFRAYFLIPSSGPAGVPKNTTARFVVRSHTPTGVENILPSETGVQKLIIDCNVYILRDGKLYTILGQTID